jgi:serine/threonine protein kinase/TPR repeat protein
MAEWQIGDRIAGKWEVKKVLRGGMGLVYVVFDDYWRRPLAIKTYPELTSEAQTVMFTREATAWIRLDCHPNVTQAMFLLHLPDREGRTLGSIIGKPHLFLEYVGGGDLREWIRSEHRGDRLTETLLFGLQLCDGLAHIYSKGISAHRDLKPENCLLSTEHDVIKLTDFGLASVHELRATLASEGISAPAQTKPAIGTGDIMGTPPYMSPEQFTDAKRADTRTDVYSFGILLFEMLTGRLPLPAGRTLEEWKYIHSIIPPDLEGIPPDLKGLLQGCLEKRPEHRSDFQQIRAALANMYRVATKRPAPPPAAPQSEGITQLGLKAVGLLELGLHEEALACLDAVLALDPDHAFAWDRKASVFYSWKRPDEAVYCADEAIKRNPKSAFSAVSWTTRANALEMKGKFDEALASIDRALALDSTYGLAWWTKADILLTLKRLEEAEYSADQAISRDGKQWLWWETKARVLAQRRKNDAALDACDRALAIHDGAASTWELRGCILSSLRMAELRFIGDAEGITDALSSLNKALELNPNSWAASQMKAWLLLFAGQYDAAITAIRRTVDLASDGAKRELDFAQRAIEQGGGCERGWSNGPPDYTHAAGGYRVAAELGHPRGQYHLGRMYEHGRGVPLDHGKAAHLYSLAAAAGIPLAQHNLGVAYYNGRGVPRDHLEAAKWFKEAAEHGVRDAQFNLAVMFKNGQGVTRDLVQAYSWFELAALQGDAEAATSRESLAGNMTADQISAATALARKRQEHEEAGRTSGKSSA